MSANICLSIAWPPRRERTSSFRRRPLCVTPLPSPLPQLAAATPARRGFSRALASIAPNARQLGRPAPSQLCSVIRAAGLVPVPASAVSRRPSCAHAKHRPPGSVADVHKRCLCAGYCAAERHHRESRSRGVTDAPGYSFAVPQESR